MSPAVVITGAASGIGRATALAAARAGYDLITWDIQGDLLGELAAQVEVAITTDSFDVTDGAARRRALEAADRKSTRLNSSHVSESRMPSSA